MIRAALILLAAGRLLAQPAFYSEDYLATWKPEYQRPLEEDYRQVVMPRLTPAERARLGEAQIEFPLFGKTTDAFEFYSLPAARPPRIVLPVSSLRFFGDVCLTEEWSMQQGRREPDPVMGYISRTKYGRAPRRNGKTLSLREAVGVPATAGDNPKIAELSSKCVSSGLLFILLHEMGHIEARERRLPSQQEEMAADGFALEIFRRLGTPPTGAVLFFSAYSYAASNRWDFPSEQEYLKSLQQSTHPVTSERLRAISRELADHAIDFKDPNPQRGQELARYASAEIRKVADFLDNPAVQRAMRDGYQ
jgi:hypothetical protein